MDKSIFIDAINAIQAQVNLDREVAAHLSAAFPNSTSASLLPQTDGIINAMIKLLEAELNDEAKCAYGYSWIEYFIWELNFGSESWRLKAYRSDNTVIPLNNAAELYDYLCELQQGVKPEPVKEPEPDYKPKQQALNFLSYKARRAMLNYSLEEVANLCNLSQSTISRIERGLTVKYKTRKQLDNFYRANNV